LAFCVRCGAELPEGAVFCPACGATRQTQQATAGQPKTRLDLASALVIIGGILGLVFALVSMFMIQFFAGMMDFGFGMMGRRGGFWMMGYPQFGVFFSGIMLLWSALALVGAILAIYSGFKLRQNKGSAIIGIIGGVLLLVTFSWIPGLLVLAGAILAYVE